METFSFKATILFVFFVCFVRCDVNAGFPSFVKNEISLKQKKEASDACSILGLHGYPELYDDVDFLHAYLHECQASHLFNISDRVQREEFEELKKALALCVSCDYSYIELITNNDRCAELLGLVSDFKERGFQERQKMLSTAFKKKRAGKKALECKMVEWSFIYLMLLDNQKKTVIRRLLTENDELDLSLSFEEVSFS